MKIDKNSLLCTKILIYYKCVLYLNIIKICFQYIGGEREVLSYQNQPRNVQSGRFSKTQLLKYLVRDNIKTYYGIKIIYSPLCLQIAYFNTDELTFHNRSNG